MKQLIVFDLDGTLAESKAALDAGMAMLLNELLMIAKVAVISGGGWPQFQKQLITQLAGGDRLANLSLLPTCGTQFYRYSGGWDRLYAEEFTDTEKAKIISALRQAVQTTGLTFGQLWGEQIEDRGSQITFSALGQQAPLGEKKQWDSDFAKRKAMQMVLTRLIPEFAVNVGGATSIDVTKPGIDKAYGIRKLHETLRIPITDMIFVGDAIFPGGNDFPAKQAGVVSIAVSGPSETRCVIEAIIACLDNGQPTSPLSEQH